MIVRRVIRNFSLIRNARRFRIPFLRKALFRVPSAISINGTMCDLQFPDELGVKNDFLGCFIEDVYGLREFNFTPRTILDVGANVGFFSMAARSYYPNALIHAYEPNPRIIAALASQARAAGFQYFSEAVGSESGAVEIAENGDSNQARTTASESGSIKQVSAGGHPQNGWLCRRGKDRLRGGGMAAIWSVRMLEKHLACANGISFVRAAHLLRCY